MSKPWIFVSGASRGIGHAVTRHLLQNTSLPIIATCRSRDTTAAKASLLDHLKLSSSPEASPSSSSSSSSSSSASPPASHPEKEDHASRLVVFQLDVTDESSVREAAERAAELFPPATHHLHLGLALPGILHPEKAPSQVDLALAADTFRVNALGPLMLMKHFGEFLPKKRTDLSLSSSSSGDGDGSSGNSNTDKLKLPSDHATWLNMSARVGSVTDNRLGGWYSYRASKAAVNSLTRTFDLHLRHRSGGRAMAFAYHPGTVKTELSQEFWANVREEKLFSPEFAAEKLCEVVASRTAAGEEHRGRIWDWDGKEIMP